MNINDKAVETLSKTISTAVNSAVENINYDKTYDGFVTEFIGNNLYNVNFNGAIYTLPLSVKNIMLSVGDFVRITIPQNNWNNMYISNSVGSISSTEGFNTKASGNYSHAEGYNTTASGNSSHAEGAFSTAGGNYSHAEGYTTIARENYSHAEGNQTLAGGIYSHSEGFSTKANGAYSHSEGKNTTASGDYSHAEGGGVDTTKITLASGQYSHAEGNHTTASGISSHAEGSESTASAFASHAEGQYCATYKDQAHAEGYMSHANGYWSHAEGNSTTNGKSSHSEGSGTTASGDYSHVEGVGTNASVYASHVIGQYNRALVGNATTYSATADALVIGNGSSSSALSNAFRVTYNGNVYGLATFHSTGADYSEYFEWLDGNVNNEDRVGRLVTIDGEKIKFANDEDYILGVVSSNPAIIGDSASESWINRYVTDIFGRIQYHEETVPDEIALIDDIYGNPKEVLIRESHIELQPILNPNYDSTKENKYKNRENRQEWDAVGMIGKLITLDDGTCDINGYCKPSNGIATKANTGYRVISRIDNNHIKILIK